MRSLAQRFWEHPNVGDVRCEGMICAIELVEDFARRRRFPVERRVGFRVSEAARKFGLLTRCIGDVLVAIDGVTLEVEPVEGAARDYRERRSKGTAESEHASSGH